MRKRAAWGNESTFRISLGFLAGHGSRRSGRRVGSLRADDIALRRMADAGDADRRMDHGADDAVIRAARPESAATASAVAAVAQWPGGVVPPRLILETRIPVPLRRHPCNGPATAQAAGANGHVDRRGSDMPDGGHGRVALWICAAILLAGAISLAETVLAPIAFALFFIALAWPLQRRLLDAGLPTYPALAVTILVSLVVLLGLALAAGWGFGRVARWIIANAAQIQLLVAQKQEWLATRGFDVDGLLQFDSRWMVRIAQAVLSQLQGVLGFVGVTLVFVILGLLEVEVTARHLARIGQARPSAAHLLQGITDTAVKLRAYMAVRTIMSIATGLAVWAFATAMGLQLALEWGVIAFVLNYIPFIGSLLATLFPTVFALFQFGSIQSAIVVFLVLQAIQFLSGSAIEPRLAGSKLAMSPFLVLVAVFVGAFLWGLPGAFIGVPALIAGLTLCEQFPASRWVARLLSGQEPA
jgi:AI-2 transport protein TqsA